MRRVILMCLLTLLSLASISCPGDGPISVVGVMYHHWWVESRWSDNPSNHPYEPVLGHYDNANADVIREHIRVAKEHGINTLILNFWITDGDWWWVERNTNAVVEVADQEGMQYFFLIDGWFEYLDAADPAFEIASRVNARAAPYFSRPGYLHHQGNPVNFFWAASRSDCPLFDAVRVGIEGTSGEITMTGSLEGCFDMRMIYNPYIPNCGEDDYLCQLEHQDSIWSGFANDGKPWVPTALPGYNDTEVRDGNPPLTLDASYFRESIQLALRDPQHQEDGTKWLLICSWSEWHEGSQISTLR